MRLVSILAAATVMLRGFGPMPADARSLPPGFHALGQPEILLRASGVTGESRAIRRDADGSTVTLVSFIAKPTKVQLAIKPVDKSGSAPKLFAANPCPKAILVTNGSFYIRDPDGSRPLGLLRVGGRTLSLPSTRTSGGFLAIDGGKPRILPRGARAEALRATDALESTPIVEENGASGIRTDDATRFDRIGIGVSKTGEVLVIAAFGVDQNSVSLFEFEQLAVWAVEQKSLALKDLLAMDGGPSAHIYLTGSRRLLGDRGVAYIPDVVCLAAR